MRRSSLNSRAVGAPSSLSMLLWLRTHARASPSFPARICSSHAGQSHTAAVRLRLLCGLVPPCVYATHRSLAPHDVVDPVYHMRRGKIAVQFREDECDALNMVRLFACCRRTGHRLEWNRGKSGVALPGTPVRDFASGAGGRTSRVQAPCIV